MNRITCTSKSMLGIILGIVFGVVAVGSAHVEVDTPEAAGLSVEKLTEMEAALNADIAAGKIPGAVVLIARKGKVGYLKSFGKQGPGNSAPMSVDSIFRIFSMTKPLITVGAMRLVEEEKLSLDDEISKYIPAFATQRQIMSDDGTVSPAKNVIRVRDLMRHTSGLIYGVFGKGILQEEYKKTKITSWDNSLEELGNIVGGLPLKFEPGTAWHYGRSVDVLTRVIEVASGEPIDLYLGRVLYTPLKMNDTSFYLPREKASRITQRNNGKFKDYTKRQNITYAATTVSTISDYYHFAKMMLNNGSLESAKIISPDTVKQMTTNQIDGFDRQYFKYGEGYGFGLGFAVRIKNQEDFPGSIGDYWWQGYGGTSFWVDPQEELIGIFMSPEPKERNYYRGEMRRWVYEALVD